MQGWSCWCHPVWQTPWSHLVTLKHSLSFLITQDKEKSTLISKAFWRAGWLNGIIGQHEALPRFSYKSVASLNLIDSYTVFKNHCSDWTADQGRQISILSWYSQQGNVSPKTQCMGLAKSSQKMQYLACTSQKRSGLLEVPIGLVIDGACPDLRKTLADLREIDLKASLIWVVDGNDSIGWRWR